MTLVERLVDIGEHYLAYASRESEAAAMLLSRVLARRDTSSTYLPLFMTKALQMLDPSASVFQVAGYAATLANLYKVAERQIMLSTVSTLSMSSAILKRLNELYSEGPLSSSSLIRKLCLKLSQRVALIGLKPKAALWRYNIGHRSLLENLQNTDAIDTNDTDEKMEAEEEEDEEEDISEDVETAIDIMLTGLQDKVIH